MMGEQRAAGVARALAPRGHEMVARDRRVGAAGIAGSIGVAVKHIDPVRAPPRVAVVAEPVEIAAEDPASQPRLLDQLGKASRGARVGQYVLIPVVDVPLKKKTKKKP